ncbi:hypothetical protein QG37_00482 [Candidozyma auris]|nr:hypothetical protein QG37_00482 [[Candida] auris]
MSIWIIVVVDGRVTSSVLFSEPGMEGLSILGSRNRTKGRWQRSRGADACNITGIISAQKNRARLI